MSTEPEGKKGDSDESEDDETEGESKRAKPAPASADDEGRDSDEDSDEEAEDEQSGRHADDEDAHEDEDDEQAPSERPKPKKARKRVAADDERRARRRKRKVKKKKRKRPLPKTEQELDAPDTQTLLMLGSLAAAVVIMAGAARLACNYHPDETRQPRAIAAAELGKDPKDAAIEVAQSWAIRDYDRALELAKGNAADELRQAQQQCVADPSCKKQREQLRDKVLTTGELLLRQATSATVRVKSLNTPAGTQTFLLELAPDATPDGAVWRVLSRRPDTGAPIRPQPTSMAPTQLGAPSPTFTAPGAPAPPRVLNPMSSAPRRVIPGAPQQPARTP